MRLFAFDDVRDWGKEICASFSALGHEAKLFTSADEVPEGQDVVCFVHMHHRLAVRAKRKEMMEKLSQKELLLIPSIREARLYDDKVKQFHTFSKWMPKTWHIQNLEEAISLTSKISYPLISKCTEGASASNVRLIKTKKEAIQEAHKVFSGDGIRLFKSKIFQKGYVLWQEYLHQPEGNDWRIILLAKRYAIVNERLVKDSIHPFASGSGKRKMLSHLDFQTASLLELTYRFATEYNLSMACVDIVFDSNHNPVILENSCGWGMYAYGECAWFEKTSFGWEPTKYVGNDMFELIAKAIVNGNFKVYE